jgi:hypothetical protein
MAPVADLLALAPPLADHGDVVSGLPFFLPPLLGIVILIAVVLHDRLVRRRRTPPAGGSDPRPGSPS